MKRFDIYLVNDSKNQINYPLIETLEDSVKIAFNVFSLSIYNLKKELDKIRSLISISETNTKKIKRMNIIFDKRIDSFNVKSILGKLNDILYSYYPITKEIKLYNIDKPSSNYMSEVVKYKDIIMNPNKTPDTYLEYVKLNTPNDYNFQVFNINETDKFPLTKAVGSGSVHPSYFVHISPKKVKPNNKNIFLIGKAITYDSGGMNIKSHGMEEMKIDMTGSAMIVSVLKLLNLDKKDNKFNIHLLIPITENMIGNKAVKPGSVIKTSGSKLVEIVNTDGEGRLCIVDAIDYIQQKLIIKFDLSKCIMIDVATLTGNTDHITSGFSSLSMCNSKGLLYVDELIKIGENIGEYVDFLKIREEYLDSLKSTVADIVNINSDFKAGCVIAGTFLEYFVDKKIPWIHLDLGVSVFVDKKPLSYGINLLYEFILQLK
jgi:leucyl aminopeptidase